MTPNCPPPLPSWQAQNWPKESRKNESTQASGVGETAPRGTEAPCLRCSVPAVKSVLCGAFGSQGGGRLEQVQLRIARHMSSSSPFSSWARKGGAPGEAPPQVQRYTVAFEVEWRSLVGVDYSNQLCTDGQVVLEAHHVVKRVFGSVGP